MIESYNNNLLNVIFVEIEKISIVESSQYYYAKPNI